MQNTVHDWMNDLVVFVEPEMTVLDALSLMRRRYINSLIVKKTEETPDYGIVRSDYRARTRSFNHESQRTDELSAHHCDPTNDNRGMCKDDERKPYPSLAS
jgi:CBS domain-containing protein